MWYFHHIPSLVQKLYSQRVWHFHTPEKVLYLTFDDGPHPSLTPEILDVLSKYRAKVTFFQLGSKIEAFPYLHERCKNEGHLLGNHGYAHLDGWSTHTTKYNENILKGAQLTDSQLFRPPFGRFPIWNRKGIFETNKIIMWDIMPGDFDKKLATNDCIRVIDKFASKGSIIVLHENDQSKHKVLDILEWTLEKYTNEGYSFDSIPISNYY